MSWSEDDFLERLMPQLRQERSGSDGACLDASTILAVIEGEADEWLRNAYAQHLAQCSACLELDSRLRNFDRPVLADETEWRRTEKRLDNWLGAFVESRAAAASRWLLEKRAARAGFWESIWRPGLAWKLSLAMGLVTLVAVGGGVYTKWRLPFWPDQGKMATSAAPAEEPSPITLPAENPHPKSEAPKSTERETPGPTAPLIPGGVINRGGPMAAAPKPPQVKAQPKPEESATVAEKANPSEPRQRAALETPYVPMAAAPKGAEVKGPPRPEDTANVASKVLPPKPQLQAALEAPRDESAIATGPSLADQLNAQYTMVKMGADSSGPAVVEPGTILAIQKGGILGVPYSDVSIVPTKYQDGEIQTPNSAAMKGLGHAFGNFGSSQQQTTHLFQVGEKVYPSKIDVNQAKDKITLSIIACDSCNNANPPIFFKGDLVFQFPKGYLGTANPTQVMDIVAQVFTVDDSGGSQLNQGDAAQGYQNGQAGAPANQPPPPALTIQLGQTTDEVVAALGQPDKIVNLGAKQIYVYKDLRVTFLKGKVSDVQ
jgi:hypothetical protein